VVEKRRAGPGLGVPVVGTAVDGLARTLGGGRGVLVPPGPPRPRRGAVRGLADERPDPALSRACARQFTPSAAAAVYASAFWCRSWSCGLQS
jgi:glycosyltransferase involved in cell wall biosynthesis